MSRRAFLLGRFRGRDTTVPDPGVVMRYPRTAADLRQAQPDGTRRRGRAGVLPLWRPPGAIDEPTFLQRCTRCGDCIDVCPENALVPAPAWTGAAAGTPTYQPERSPCTLCEDQPCIPACTVGALTLDIPQHMGTARIDTQVCLAHQGTFCSTCSERCPVAGAITVDQGRPRVVEDLCAGCGVCAFVCPAPQNAILLMPAAIRPHVSPTSPEAL